MTFPEMNKRIVDVNTDHDCNKEGEHFDAVSSCCGGRQHEYVNGMCNSCNEMTSWVCSVCDSSMDIEVYN